MIYSTAMAAAAWAAPAPASHLPALARCLRVARVTGLRGVALTFDDGPHDAGTPAVLDILARHDAQATFFVIGDQVRRRPDLLREIAAAGHAIAIHGFAHRCQLRMTGRQIAEDLDRAADTVGSVLGTTPTWQRPPYGVYSTVGLAHVRRRGWTPMLWSKWGRDWTRSATPSSVARRCTDGLVDGDVVLLHDADHYASRGSWEATVGSLPLILAAMRRTGLQPVALPTRETL